MAIDKIRVGIIGAGQNTRKMHIPKLMGLPGVELIEVANRTIASSKKVASEFNIPRVRSSWQEIINSEDVDAIVIGTWPYLHCEASCAALQSGKHVLCEARMAMNHSEAQLMLQASEASPHLTAQLVPAPFTLHADKTISAYIDHGRLGELLHFQVDFQSNSITNLDGFLHWRRNKKYSGENVMFLGIIYESILRWTVPAIKVSATGNIFINKAIDPESGKQVPIEIPDYLSVQMELENGIHGSMLITETSPHASPPTIKIFGSEGCLKIDFIPDGKLWYGAKADDSMQEVEILPHDKGSWRVEEEFINAIRGKEEVKLTTFNTGVEYMRFTQAVMESYREDGNTKP